jgi:hypothetical protein
VRRSSPFAKDKVREILSVPGKFFSCMGYGNFLGSTLAPRNHGQETSRRACVSAENILNAVNMARRGSTKTNPFMALLGLLVVGGLAVGAYSLLGREQEPYRTVQTLDGGAYLDNANGLRGNVYKTEATVLNSLAWVPSKGRLYSFEIKNGTRTDVVAVLVPAQFNAINLQKGQHFWLKVEVGDGGVLVAQDLVKT